MKTTRFFHTAAAALALLLFFSAGLHAQLNQPEILQFDEIIKVSDLGDAELHVKIKLTARQFVNWKQKYGTNPSLLKRDIGKDLTNMETYAFGVEQNDLERTLDIHYKAKGMALYRGVGQYRIMVPKGWKQGQRKDNNYEFHYPEVLAPGVIAQHSVRVELPPAAASLREQLAEQGDRLIEYTMPGASSGKVWNSLGIIFAMAGVGCLVMAFVKPGGKAVAGGPTPT